MQAMDLSEERQDLRSMPEGVTRHSLLCVGFSREQRLHIHCNGSSSAGCSRIGSGAIIEAEAVIILRCVVTSAFPCDASEHC